MMNPKEGSPGWVARLVGASSYTLKGSGLATWSGHIPRLQFDPQLGRVREATNQSFSLTMMSLSPFLSFSPPLLGTTLCGFRDCNPMRAGSERS